MERLFVCEYDGLIHGWANIWNAVSVNNMVGLYSGGGGGLIVGGLRCGNSKFRSTF